MLTLMHTKFRNRDWCSRFVILFLLHSLLLTFVFTNNYKILPCAMYYRWKNRCPFPQLTTEWGYINRLRLLLRLLPEKHKVCLTAPLCTTDWGFFLLIPLPFFRTSCSSYCIVKAWPYCSCTQLTPGPSLSTDASNFANPDLIKIYP